MQKHLYLMFVVLACVMAPAAERMNVLFIAVDDLRPELRCYGQQHIMSPNIDKLAQRGVRFDRAYCQQAVCNPSRVSLLTGLRPDSTRVWDLRTRLRTTIPDVITLPQHFKNHGYTTVGMGKIFHNNMPDEQSWTVPKQPQPAPTATYSQATLTKMRQERDEARVDMQEFDFLRQEQAKSGRFIFSLQRAIIRLRGTRDGISQAATEADVLY